MRRQRSARLRPILIQLLLRRQQSHQLGSARAGGGQPAQGHLFALQGDLKQKSAGFAVQPPLMLPVRGLLAVWLCKTRTWAALWQATARGAAPSTHPLHRLVQGDECGGAAGLLSVVCNEESAGRTTRQMEAGGQGTPPLGARAAMPPARKGLQAAPMTCASQHALQQPALPPCPPPTWVQKVAVADLVVLL